MARKIDLDIDDMKRRRKSKKRTRFLIKLLVVLLLLASGIIIYATKDSWIPYFHGILSEHIIHKNNTGEVAEGNFPIKITGTTDYQCEKIGEHLAVLEDTKLYIYSGDGGIVNETQCALTNSVMKTNDSKALIYDKGGYKFQLESKYKNIYNNKLKDKIILARIAPNDYTAVVTESEKFLSVLSIYDENDRNIYTWRSVEGRIIDVAFNKHGGGCIVTVLKTKGGNVISSMYNFDFSSSVSNEQWISDSLDTLVVNSSVLSDGSIIAIGDTKCYYLDRDGKTEGSYTYKAQMMDFSTEGGITAILTENSKKRENILTIINNSTDSISELLITGGAKSVEVYKNYIYVMTNSAIVAYSADGEKVSEVGISDEYHDFRVINNHIYLLGLNEIDRIDFNI